MSESVRVCCPACRHEHVYTAPSYPCVCGAPVAPPLNRLREPAVITHRTWDDDWVAVRCEICGRKDQWPHPELGCPCGTILRIPVKGVQRPPSAARPAYPNETSTDTEGDKGDKGNDAPEGSAPHEGHESDGRRKPRPGAFRPVTIRTARDAVTTAALYLRWLGYHDIRRAGRRSPKSSGLAASGILAQVDASLRPASLRDVECLWLTAMSQSTSCVYFSLAGYADDARAVADSLRVPLFVLDLTGTPQPVNSLADELADGGA